jgi:hypothetical protein
LTQQAPFSLKKALEEISVSSNANNTATNPITGSSAATNTASEELSDGLKEVEAESILRFPEDDRVHEVIFHGEMYYF